MKFYVSFVVLGFCVFTAYASADNDWYKGVIDGSDKNLLQVCKDYLNTSFSKDDPDYYMKLVPPIMKKKEEKVIKSFHKKHLKRFGNKDKKFTILEFKPIERFVHKGVKIAEVEYGFKTNAMKFRLTSSCYFKKNKNGAWYLGRLP
ncbi:hypothetical protein [Aliikangiella sp. IMCC44632]